jgi:hypothetical protein
MPLPAPIKARSVARSWSSKAMTGSMPASAQIRATARRVQAAAASKLLCHKSTRGSE